MRHELSLHFGSTASAEMRPDHCVGGPKVCVPRVSTFSVFGPIASHGFGNFVPECFRIFFASLIDCCVWAKSIVEFGNARFE